MKYDKPTTIRINMQYTQLAASANPKRRLWIPDSFKNSRIGFVALVKESVIVKMTTTMMEGIHIGMVIFQSFSYSVAPSTLADS